MRLRYIVAGGVAVALAVAAISVLILRPGTRHLQPGADPGFNTGPQSLAQLLAAADDAAADSTAAADGATNHATGASATSYDTALRALARHCGRDAVESIGRQLEYPLVAHSRGSGPQGHILEILRYAVDTVEHQPPAVPSPGARRSAGSTTSCGLAVAGRELAEGDARPADTAAYTTAVAALVPLCAVGLRDEDGAMDVAGHVAGGQDELTQHGIRRETLRSLADWLLLLAPGAPDLWCPGWLSALRAVYQDGAPAGPPGPAANPAVVARVRQFVQAAAAAGGRCGSENEQTGPGGLPAIEGPMDVHAVVAQIDNLRVVLAQSGAQQQSNQAMVAFLDAAVSPQSVPAAAAANDVGMTAPNAFGCSSAMHVLYLAGEDRAIADAVTYDRLAVSVAWRCQATMPHEGILLQQLDDNVPALVRKGLRTRPRLAQLRYLDAHLPVQPPSQFGSSDDCAYLLRAFTAHPVSP